MSLVFSPATTGGWLLVASHSRAVVVDASVRPDLLDAVWAVIGEAEGFQLIIDALTRHGLAATPSFALLDWNDAEQSLRLLLRGALSVDVDGTTAATITAEGVSTWVERSITGASSARMVVPGAVAIDGTLPLDSGAVLAASVHVAFGAGPQAAVQTSAQPAAPAQPEPSVPAPAATPAVAPAPAAPPAKLSPKKAEQPAVDIEATVTDAPRAEVEPQPAAAADDDGYDYLFGATMYRSVSDAAVREDEPADPAPPEGEPAEGDHDGHTVLTSDIAKIRKQRRAASEADRPVPEDEPAGPIALLFSSGLRERLDQPILIGRSPSISQVSGGNLPKLVTIGGIEQDISRNHAQVTLEGGTVVVTDLHSKNGTSVALPGKSAQKLRAGEPTAIIMGTVIDLGGGITATVVED